MTESLDPMETADVRSDVRVTLNSNNDHPCKELQSLRKDLINRPAAVPRVAAAVFVRSKQHPGCILVGSRKGKIGTHTYAIPGGHLEFGEDWCTAGERELIEETGLKLESLELACVTNCHWTEQQNTYHYVEGLLVGDVDCSYKSEPENLEPHKCDGWSWLKYDESLKKLQLFHPLRDILEHGFSPFDTDTWKNF